MRLQSQRLEKLPGTLTLFLIIFCQNCVFIISYLSLSLYFALLLLFLFACFKHSYFEIQNVLFIFVKKLFAFSLQLIGYKFAEN